MVVQRRSNGWWAGVAFVGAALLTISLYAAPAFAAPELEVAHSGKLLCHLSCATYIAAFKRSLQESVDRKAITQDSANKILEKENANPNNRCGPVGLEKVPKDQRGCAEGTYLQELVPTGYEIIEDAMCGGCPTHLGARWCETNSRERDVEVLSLNRASQFTHLTRGGTQFWSAPNKKTYVIKDGEYEFKAQPLGFDGISLTPAEAAAYQRSLAEVEKNRVQVNAKWNTYSEKTINFEYRCCEDRDGDGMPACSPGSQHMVVSARDPNKYTSGLGLIGPDCDDTSATITPAKGGPVVKYVYNNREWADRFEKRRGDEASQGSTTVITPSDVGLDPGMCWINYEPLPFSLSLSVPDSQESLPIDHTEFVFAPIPPDALSGEGGVSEELFPARRPPLSWETNLGMMPNDRGPWFKEDRRLEQAIKMVAGRSPPKLEVKFTYGEGFSSVYDVGLSNCFRLTGGKGREIVFRRGETLQANLREFLRSFVLPYTSAEQNGFAENGSALLSLSPYSDYKDRVALYLDLSKVPDNLTEREGQFFRNRFVASQGSACSPSHTVLIHDNPEVYFGFANRGGDAYIGALSANQTLPESDVGGYDWMMTSVVVTHELGHAFGQLEDEYVETPTTEPKTPIMPANCSVNPLSDFSSNGKVYAEQPFLKGCSNHHDWYRPTLGSYMNNPAGEPSTRVFNAVSCGYLVARMIGGNPKDYFSGCSMVAKR